MRRHQIGSVARDPSGWVYDFEVEAILEALCGRGDETTDGVFRLVAELDPDEQERARRRQIVYLARYGRQSMLQWDEVDVLDLIAFHNEVSTMVGEENSLHEDP